MSVIFLLELRPGKGQRTRGRPQSRDVDHRQGVEDVVVRQIAKEDRIVVRACSLGGNLGREVRPLREGGTLALADRL